MVEAAVLVVDATTHHGPATRLPCTNDSGTVRADTSSLTLGGPNSPNWFLNLDTTAGTNTTHLLNVKFAAARVALVVTSTEARVADTAISMHPHLLEARQMIPLATKFVLTTAGHSIATRALHIVPVAVARLASDALESLGGGCTAPTHVAGEPTSTETHVAPPRTVAHWHGCFEGSLPVPGTVVVVHTTTCCDVACWQVSSCSARAILVCTACRARHATQPTLTAVAVKPARPEASVAAPVGALRVRLLKGGEMVEVAVLVVDATTHHGPATRLPCANDSRTVRADTRGMALRCPPSPRRHMFPVIHGFPPSVILGPTFLLPC